MCRESRLLLPARNAAGRDRMYGAIRFSAECALSRQKDKHFRGSGVQLSGEIVQVKYASEMQIARYVQFVYVACHVPRTLRFKYANYTPFFFTLLRE